MGYGTQVTVDRPFADTVAQVRQALAAQGFGVLTEIDVQATMQAKLGEAMDPYLILGACNPPLAHAALVAEPSLGLLLPCNVVVRSLAVDRTEVEAIDPTIMVGFTGNPALEPIAAQAAERLGAALAALAAPAARASDAGVGR